MSLMLNGSQWENINLVPPDTYTWQPTQIASLVAWWSFRDTSTLFQDTGATTPVVAANDPIRLCQDKSGNGNDLTAPTDAARPLWNSAGYAVFLAASAQYMTISSFDRGAAQCWALGANTDIANMGTNGTLLCSSANYFNAFGLNYSTSEYEYYRTEANANVTGFGAVSVDAWHPLIANHSSAVSAEVIIEETSSGVFDPENTYDSTDLSLAAQTDGGGPMSMFVTDVLIFNAGLTAHQINLVQDFLRVNMP